MALRGTYSECGIWSVALSTVNGGICDQGSTYDMLSISYNTQLARGPQASPRPNLLLFKKQKTRRII